MKDRTTTRANHPRFRLPPRHESRTKRMTMIVLPYGSVPGSCQTCVSQRVYTLRDGRDDSVVPRRAAAASSNQLSLGRG